MTINSLGIDYDVFDADAIAPGALIGIRAGPWHVLLIRSDTGLHAVNNRCSHAAARLQPGLLRGEAIMCPRHGARFDLDDGRCVSADYPAIRVFPLRVESGRVIVTVPRTPPDLSELPIP